MDLDDFGDPSKGNGVIIPEDPHSLNGRANAKAPEPAVCEETEKEIILSKLTQWASSGPNRFSGVGPSRNILPPGMYNIGHSNTGLFVEKITIKTDDLLDFPHGIPQMVLKEANEFWKLSERFAQYGFLHRRGYLLYGSAGCGKTAIIQLIAHKVIEDGDLVFVCGNPNLLMQALVVLRQIEPERRVVCVFEDLDALAANYDQAALLAVLDGEQQIDHCLSVATTNYPERLDPRLIMRPRRFDRVLKIEPPPAETRRMYLEKKLKISDCKDLELWVEKTEGFSFAALAELVISVKCLGNDFEASLKGLRELFTKKVSSDEFRGKAGFTATSIPKSPMGLTLGEIASPEKYVNE